LFGASIKRKHLEKLEEKMDEEHNKMTKQDKLVLGITLSAIFFGVFLLGLIGVLINLSS